LVTNKTWENFWLNEGMTVYTERKIYGRMAGEQMRHFKAIIGWRSLQESVNTFGKDSPLTALQPDLTGIDPDDAFSSVPYEKGFALLFYLEGLVGTEPFEHFLRAYIEKFKFSVVTSEDFIAFFNTSFRGKVEDSVLDKIDWQTWLKAPGMPPFVPKFDQTLSVASQALAEKWIAGGKDAKPEDLKDWSAGQIVVFLDKLVEAPQPLSEETLDRMDQLYHFTGMKNAEVRHRWYQVSIRAEYEKVFPHVVGFLLEQGRMKYVRPLYRALYKSAKGKDLARQTFLQNRQIYHNIASKMIAKDLEVQ